MAPSLTWCAQSADQDTCHRYHVWGKLRPGPGRGKDRECPTCGANMSVSKGEKGMWVVWHCHGGCDARIVRDALEHQAGIAPRCLGSYASDDYEARREQRGGDARNYSHDPANLAAARRSWAYAKLAGAEVRNASLLRMCLQAISESDGSVPGDPDQLLPRDYKEFVALAKRTGIERCHAAKLARSYLS